jgi:hypothetical protein
LTTKKRRVTIYMDEELSIWLQHHAIDQRRKVSHIIEELTRKLRETQETRGEREVQNT